MLETDVEGAAGLVPLDCRRVLVVEAHILEEEFKC